MKVSLEGVTREHALHVLRDLRQRLDTKAGKSANEAATRLLVVDEILIALGWTKEDFNPETRSGTGFTDYLLSIDGMPRLVVEAKRVGHTFASTKRLAKTEYTVSYVRSAFGQKLTDVLDQADGYAKEHGVPFAALTNGLEWILVQLIPQPGQTPDDLKCFHFDFSREDGNFELFWELLSRDGVDSGRMGESFAELNAVEFEFSAVPCRELGPFTWRRPASDDLLLDEYYRLFMDEIVDPARRHMLQQCFVTSARLDQYEGNLKRVLKDSAPEYIDAQRDLSPGEHSTLLPASSGDQRGRVILVTGSVGCGKSTFVTKVLVEIRKKKTSESLLVDLTDDAEAFVDDVTGLLWNRVLEKWRLRKPECIEYAMLRTIFHGEVEQLKGGAKAKLFERDENAFVQAEAELLERCAHNP